MSIPVSKVIVRTIVPSSEKVTVCCGSKKHKRVLQGFVCQNKGCENNTKATELVLSDGKTDVTKYKIRPLTAEERGRLEDESLLIADFAEGKGGTRPHTMVRLYVLLSLVGWENFDAKFSVEEKEVLDLGKKRTITSECFNEIPYQDVMDIAYEARMFESLNGDEEKN